MAKLLKEIDFSKPIKLEVGSGGAPVPGYIHCDMSEGMPDLHIQCQMGVEQLPIPDASCEEILSNHSMEHIPWLQIPQLLSDWNRVLIPGGKLFLRTPDLEFICKTYLERKTTREHPVDESNMVSVFGDCGPGEWTNIKLFAGQNYPGNFHFYCLDFDMLTRVLDRFGFERIERLKVGPGTNLPEYSPGEICAVAYKKV